LRNCDKQYGGSLTKPTAVSLKFSGQGDTMHDQQESLRARALEIHELLCREYHCPIRYFHNLDPLSELVSSMLSHRTRNADSGRAFKTLRAKFPTWREVMEAPVKEVETAISAATWPEQKAPRIQTALRLVADQRSGDLSLDFLKEMEPIEARHWLEQIPGVGPKTSAAVLIFSTLRIPALPVDCHHHRVAGRLGLIPKKMAVGPAHDVLAAQLPKDWDAQKVYDNHEVLMIHGQRCCYFEAPACERCVLLELCPEGQKRLGVGTTSGKTQPTAPSEASPTA
jgi:endonuclease III